MRGVARSFWAVVAVAIAVEAFIGVLAVRSVRSDLTCWVSGLRDGSNPNCGTSVALVGRQGWAPAALALLLCGATVLAGLATLVSRYVRTRLALRRLGSFEPSPPVLLRLGAELGIDVRLCRDGRCFCCCAGLFSPRVIISQGMFELLDEPQLTAVLAHEAAHVRHRDPARALAVQCAANALFYLPVARFLSKKALVASELGADSMAATIAGQPALIRALLEVLGRVRPVLGTVTEMASLDALDSRIEALRTKALPRTRPRPVIGIVSVVVLSAVVLLGVWLPQPANRVKERPGHRVVPVTPATRGIGFPHRTGQSPAPVVES
jgi:Zn-dependent protease with chaperone function